MTTVNAAIEVSGGDLNSLRLRSQQAIHDSPCLHRSTGNIPATFFSGGAADQRFIDFAKRTLGVFGPQ